jgi:hypothetical protein
VYFDNEKIGSNWNSSSNLGSFILRPSNYNDGEHIIRIEHTFTTGSGSIRDQVNEEKLVKIESFNLIIKRKPATPPAITNAIIENGSITINWAETNVTDFENAYLSLKLKNYERRIPLTNSSLGLKSYVDTSTILITGPSNSSYYDSYTSVKYAIVFQSKYEESYGASKTVSFDPSWMDIQISYVDNNSYKVLWKKHPLYANFKQFEIQLDGEQIIVSNLGGEKTINKPYIIGKKYSAYIHITNNQNSLPYFQIKDVKLDKNSFGIFEYDHLYSLGIIFNPSNQKYYSLIVESERPSPRIYAIYEYSTDMKFLRKKSLPNNSNGLSFRKNFHLNPINFNLHFDFGGSSYEIDKNSLEITTSYLNHANKKWSHILRGDILFSWNDSEKNVVIKNIKNNITIHDEIIKYVPNLHSNYGGVLSNDAKYVHIPDYLSSIGTIYKVENDKLVKVMETSNSTVQFHQDKAFYITRGKVHISNMIAKTTKSFNYGTFPHISFDSHSQKILIQQSGSNGIYDLKDETLKLFFSEANKDYSPLLPSDRSYQLHLQNNRLIHTKGIFIDNF